MASDTADFDQTGPAEPMLTRPASAGWTSRDLATGAALVTFLIALFLPWFTVTVRTVTGPLLTGMGSGTAVHGYLWFAFALGIVALAALAGRDALSRAHVSLPSAGQLLAGATVADLVLAILAVVTRPPGATVSTAVPGSSLALTHLPVVGWSYGGFVAVAAAAAALAATIEVPGPLRSARTLAGGSLRRSVRRAARQPTWATRPRRRPDTAGNGLAAIGFTAPETAGPAQDQGPTDPD